MLILPAKVRCVCTVVTFRYSRGDSCLLAGRRLTVLALALYKGRTWRYSMLTWSAKHQSVHAAVKFRMASGEQVLLGARECWCGLLALALLAVARNHCEAAP
jgi:hypothetical protein